MGKNCVMRLINISERPLKFELSFNASVENVQDYHCPIQVISCDQFAGLSPNNQRNQDQGAQGEFVNREADYYQIRKEHARCQEGFFLHHASLLVLPHLG